MYGALSHATGEDADTRRATRQNMNSVGRRVSLCLQMGPEQCLRQVTGMVAHVRVSMPSSWPVIACYTGKQLLKWCQQSWKYCTLDDAVKRVHHFKSSSFKARTFKCLCEETGRDHRKLLLQTVVGALLKAERACQNFCASLRNSFFMLQRPLHFSYCLTSASWL
jgi:hypothetical protein